MLLEDGYADTRSHADDGLGLGVLLATYQAWLPSKGSTQAFCCLFGLRQGGVGEHQDKFFASIAPYDILLTYVLFEPTTCFAQDRIACPMPPGIIDVLEM